MKGFILLAVTFFSVTAFASNRYKINAKIFVDGKLVSTPQLIVNEGEPAEMEINDSTTHNKMKIKVVATDVADEKVKNEILMKMQVEYNSPSHQFMAAPQILAKAGSEATIRLGNGKGHTDAQMKVVASRE